MDVGVKVAPLTVTEKELGSIPTRPTNLYNLEIGSSCADDLMITEIEKGSNPLCCWSASRKHVFSVLIINSISRLYK